MPTYLTPNVYVEEVPTLPASIVPVSTAIPAFIGYASPISDASLVSKATRISTLKEFTDQFELPPAQALRVTVEEGAPTQVEIDGVRDPYRLFHQLRMYFLNGGGPCYVIPVGTYDDLPDGQRMSVHPDGLGGLDIAEREDEITLLVFPDAATLSPVEYYALYDAALAQCARLKDRFTIIDVRGPEVNSTLTVTLRDFRNQSLNVDNLNYGAAYYPNLDTILSYDFDPDSMTFVDTAGAPIDPATLVSDTQFISRLQRMVNAFPIELAPSGAIAGVYARTDFTRGVFKAPANVSLSGVVAPTMKITDQEQQGMNVDSSGKSVNAIRSFTGKGILVWGARTLEGNSNEWRYVSVRRFFIFAETSIKRSLEPVVFEPNNESTWISVRASIESFLESQWRAGALLGSTPDKAFFVRVGLGQTMTAQDVLEGNLIVEVGMAVVRPAEFIVLRFMHKFELAQ